MDNTGYRIFIRKDGKGVSLADDHDLFDITPGAVESREEGFEIGMAPRECFDYIEMPGESSDQVLVTYHVEKDDMDGKPDGEGNVKVFSATIQSIEALLGDPMEVTEKLTYAQLYNISEPKRKLRAETVRGPALEIDPTRDSLYYWFNFKSYPSTTGLRHRGYSRFFKPKGLISAKDKRPLEAAPCMVDCTCPDYRYRWAFNNKQRGSGRVGTGTLNQAWNRPPRITNPSGAPGMCKHLLAMKEYIYGNTSNFRSPDDADTSRKMKKQVDYANKRWINLPTELDKAKQRDAEFRKMKQARTQGEIPFDSEDDIPLPEPLPGDDGEEEKKKIDDLVPDPTSDEVRLSKLKVPDPPEIGSEDEPDTISRTDKPSFLQRLKSFITRPYQKVKSWFNKSPKSEKEKPQESSVIKSMDTKKFIRMYEDAELAVTTSNPGEEALALLGQIKDLLFGLVQSFEGDDEMGDEEIGLGDPSELPPEDGGGAEEEEVMPEDDEGFKDENDMQAPRLS